ncbi:hypothetical protein ACSQ67_015616 [Phaseolus vulgaris]
MAAPKIHLLSSFLLCSTFLCFLHCTLSLLDPEDEVGILVQADDVEMVQSNRDSRKIWYIELANSNPSLILILFPLIVTINMDMFDALRFLGRMRRKRIMLVGDSMIRNQWESLVCLVQGVIPTDRKRVTYKGPAMAFHAMDFETSIEFFWAPLLVEVKKGSENKRIVHLDLIEENARYWRGVDILVFDSAHWWTHSDQTSSWDYYMVGNNLIRNMSAMAAYQRGLSTWARWVDQNLDPLRTQVIFRSMSSRHNRENGWKCYNQKQPLPFFSHLQVPEPLVVLQGVLKRMRFPVYLQDITTMTELRRDGHPSVYMRAIGQNERQKQGKGLSSDCSHWCLPGVPDIWNEMLSALL